MEKREDVFSRMNDIFDTLKRTVSKLSPPKRKRLVLEWIDVWHKYLSLENSFKPSSLRRYERGDVIFANFGFKVGNELGGCHYAIVIENENQPTNGTVIVIPMKSIEKEEELASLDWKDFNLGKGIIPWKMDIYNIAKVNQVCALSKMRIIKPKSQHERIINIAGTGLLEEIDKLLMKICTSKNTNNSCKDTSSCV